MFKTIFLRTILRNHNEIFFKNKYISFNILSTKYTNTQPINVLSSIIARNIYQTENRHSNALFFTENNHAHKVMHSLEAYSNTLCKVNLNQLNTSLTGKKEEFEKLLNKNWRSETATNIVNGFKIASVYSEDNGILLSDHRFDKLVDGLMDKCQDLTDNELSDLILCIKQYPQLESITSHNFHDIWSALDDICISRISGWSLDTLLYFADHWFQLGLHKYSDFVVHVIKKMFQKVHQLTPSQLVQSLFFINICRKSWSMFDFECQLEKHIDKLTTDELAIVGMAFFKTQTSIKGTFLLAKMLEKILEETATVNEISLSAILKVIRYSPHIPVVDQLRELLTRLVPEINRLSLLCCVHIALAGTNTQLFHPEILTKISEKFVNNISTARLKDLERLTFTLTLYNFNPKTSKPIFEVIHEELHRPERNSEFEKHPRCLSCCLHYLGLQNIYDYKLISTVLGDNFLRKAYGNNKQKIGREILFLNTSLRIECTNYEGNYLTEKLQERLSRWSTEFIPRRDQKQHLNAANKLMLDIIETTKNVVHDGEEYVHTDFILPHFSRADIIICKDKDGRPVKIEKHFKKYKLGEIMKPLEDGNIWYAIIVAGWNSYIRGTIVPTGLLATKIRQLKKIGFVPVMVPWHEFANLTKQQKEEYIKNKIMLYNF